MFDKLRNRWLYHLKQKFAYLKIHIYFQCITYIQDPNFYRKIWCIPEFWKIFFFHFQQILPRSYFQATLYQIVTLITWGLFAWLEIQPDVQSETSNPLHFGTRYVSISEVPYSFSKFRQLDLQVKKVTETALDLRNKNLYWNK